MNYHDVMEMVKDRAKNLGLKRVPPTNGQPDPEMEAIKLAMLETMSTAGWKEVQVILDEVIQSPLTFLDEKSVAELNLADAGFIKGVRSAVKTIRQKIEARIR